jgi:hypothetical protein
MASGVTARHSLLVFIFMLRCLPDCSALAVVMFYLAPWVQSLDEGVLLQCFHKYIYSLYTIKIIIFAITKATTELSVVFKQLMDFVQFSSLS